MRISPSSNKTFKKYNHCHHPNIKLFFVKKKIPIAIDQNGFDYSDRISR